MSIEIPNIKIPKIEIPKIEIPSINFSKLVTKTHKTIDKLEQEENQLEESPESNTIIENSHENSETIINSLFSQQDDDLISNEPTSEVQSEHTVDPDDYALYKKYLS